MKYLVEARTLVETFGEWANASSLERFWGVAMAGDGRACLLLPTSDTVEYRAVLAPGLGRVWLVMGPVESGYDNLEFDVGGLDESPAAIFDRVTAFLIEKAESSLKSGDFETAIEAAHIAWRINHYLGDTTIAAEALKLKLKAISS